MAQTRAAGSGPIPPAKKDDSEDVAWALSTAEAMFARGDGGDALKWLRRAAESASEAQADDRALELAKAAAELASVLGPSASAPPPPIAAPPPPDQLATQPAAPVIRPAAAAARPGAPPPPPPPPAQASAAGMRPKPPAHPAPAPAVTPVAPRIIDTRRSGRRSRPEIQISRPIDEVTQVTTPPAQPPVARRRGRSSGPPPAEVSARAPAPPPTPSTARAHVVTHGEMDAWPTESGVGDLPVPAPDPEEKTRIGVPAYDPSTQPPAELASSPVVIEDPSIRSSQAVRVIVWRAADGVHIAPHGTRVAAITVDAVLVALDPSADLTAWLTGK
jgi:hypothetical protein